MGVLAVARSFGDFVLKRYVTAEPFTSSTRLDATVCLFHWCCIGRFTVLWLTDGSCVLQCQFVIVACDGIWDVMTDQEAIDVVRCYF